ncbi:uncharacterized protein LAESUDRAFT_729783 [Laetiporus sulphureus 93-53]|uniref:DUF6533 domain-containing protein n=1 Tax=Laetiporus sulphureus 93-53 TaxID=1314785 RepID=A0A165CHF6_9APHY|nr:uncharacterized protein LAESUDRAFT_729783 [Laetiporus sulphureus 93-53]KZT02819.1 hypothetical protein LAESUDRAFT_729783 [Laetiporus sulphureus 93-53]
MSTSSLEYLEALARDEAAVNAMTLAGFTVLIYDHVLTVSENVNYIWRARMGIVSVIFLLNRYIVPLVLVIDIYEAMGLSGNPSSVLFCKIWTVLQGYLTIASFMSIHAIVAWRLYCLHGGEAWIRRVLCTAAVLYVSSSTAIITVSLVPIIRHLKPEHHQCVSSVPSYLWTAWLPSVVFETLLFVLTVVAMLRQERRRSFSSLSLLLYRDGMLYFVAVTVCSLLSLLVWALAGPAFLGLARYFALAMVNVAGSRLVLNLKGFSASRCSVDFVSDSFSMVSSEAALTTPYWNARRQNGTDASEIVEGDLDMEMEMYSIERDCQQLGTKFLHSP